jgi:hypothetical protein
MPSYKIMHVHRSPGNYSAMVFSYILYWFTVPFASDRNRQVDSCPVPIRKLASKRRSPAFTMNAQNAPETTIFDDEIPESETVLAARKSSRYAGAVGFRVEKDRRFYSNANNVIGRLIPTRPLQRWVALLRKSPRLG